MLSRTLLGMALRNVVDKSDIPPQSQHLTVFTFCNLETGSDVVLSTCYWSTSFFAKRHEADDKSILSIFCNFLFDNKTFFSDSTKKYIFFC